MGRRSRMRTVPAVQTYNHGSYCVNQLFDGTLSVEGVCLYSTFYGVVVVKCALGNGKRYGWCFIVFLICISDVLLYKQKANFIDHAVTIHNYYSFAYCYYLRFSISNLVPLKSNISLYHAFYHHFLLVCVYFLESE